MWLLSLVIKPIALQTNGDCAGYPLLPPNHTMNNTQSTFDSEFLKKLEYLYIVSKKIFAGRIKAERRSTRRGVSVEFADYRNYTAGDDFRYIDWNAFARLDELLLKL